MKRFKIEYGAQPKLDKWGHFTKNQPPMYTAFHDTLAEALKEADVIAKEHRKFYVNVLDMDVEFEGEKHTVMLVVGYDRGIAWYNENYKLS